MATARASARVPARTPRTSTRVRRTSPRQGPRAPVAIAERMVAEAILVAATYIDRLMRALRPLLEERFGGRRDSASMSTRHDATSLAEVFERVQEGELSRDFLARMFRLTDQQAANDLARVVAVSPDQTLAGAGALQQQWVRRNTELIRMEARAREEVRKIIEGPIREGVRVEDIRARIEERLGVVRSRAELIARDQTLKLYGQLQEERQTQAGIEEYIWSTAEDERVRPAHAALEGTTQRWDSPPVIDPKTGRRGHPGDDYNCRCAAIPILPTEGISEEPPSTTRPRSLPPGEPANDVPELALPVPANDVPGPGPIRAAAPPPPPPATPPAPPPAAPPEPPAPPAPPPSPPPPPPSEPPSRPPSQRPLGTLAEARRAFEQRAFDRPLAQREYGTMQRVLGRAITPRELDAVIGRDALAVVPGPVRRELVVSRGEVQLEVNIGTDARLIRTFQRRKSKLVVHHDLLKLAEHLQEGGIGTRVIAAQLPVYEALGVDRIELEAAWVGRYRWPSLGWDVPEADRLKYVGKFRDWLETQGLGPAVVSELTRNIASMQDLANTLLGDRKIGKDFLLLDPKRDPHAIRFIPKLSMKIRPGEPLYERMKAAVNKPREPKP